MKTSKIWIVLLISVVALCLENDSSRCESLKCLDEGWVWIFSDGL